MPKVSTASRSRPSRTEGGTRRYSEDDLERLRRISKLVDDGLNLAGIGMVLGLEHDKARLQAANTRLRDRR